MSEATYLGIIGALYLAPHLSKAAGYTFGVAFLVISMLLKMNGA